MAVLRLAAFAGSLLLPLAADAHGFGRLYNLPVPFWLYGWAASAALLLSFLVTALFATAPQPGPASMPRDISRSRLANALRVALPALKTVSGLLLLLTLATAWFGNGDPFRNFSMTFFWVVFLLGGSYFTALLGNAYALLNPWQVLADLLGGVWRGYLTGRVRYREHWADWPALVLYLGFIWFELFGLGKPGSLAHWLAGYTLLNVIGVWLVGRTAWFTHCEFFAVFLRLLGHMAPLVVGRGLGLRAPLAGLLQERPQHISTVVFALAMLSTTAFDGLRATQWWVQLFWGDRTGMIMAITGAAPLTLFASLRPWYIAWETLSLLASPFIYLAAYLACLAAARSLARSQRPLRELALDFGYTLLPIALVYHLTHYATLLLSQGLKIISLASDPFGWGWDLFGTAWLLRGPILPGMGMVWHTQVGLILLGHIASVWVAHRIALRVFASRRAALFSQLPMLLLMMALTVAGLWIIAQPLTVERMR